MVITIHKLSIGSFTFLQCLSGTELLDLSGTPDNSNVDVASRGCWDENGILQTKSLQTMSAPHDDASDPEPAGERQNADFPDISQGYVAPRHDDAG
jgi:hypothetical protein